LAPIDYQRPLQFNTLAGAEDSLAAIGCPFLPNGMGKSHAALTLVGIQHRKARGVSLKNAAPILLAH
jgi:hypothetical protein